MDDRDYETRLKAYIAGAAIAAEHLSFDKSCHSVQEAADVVGGVPEDFVKNICFVDGEGAIVVAIVKGEDKVDKSRLCAASGARKLRPATADEILASSGYPCGGTPSFGFPARFYVDERVLERAVVYTGGGSPTSLVRVEPSELVRANGAVMGTIRRDAPSV